MSHFVSCHIIIIAIIIRNFRNARVVVSFSRPFIPFLQQSVIVRPNPELSSSISVYPSAHRMTGTLLLASRNSPVLP